MVKCGNILVLLSRQEKNLERSHVGKRKYGAGDTGDRLVMQQVACKRGTFHLNVLSLKKYRLKILNLMNEEKTVKPSTNYYNNRKKQMVQ